MVEHILPSPRASIQPGRQPRLHGIEGDKVAVPLARDGIAGPRHRRDTPLTRCPRSAYSSVSADVRRTSAMTSPSSGLEGRCMVTLSDVAKVAGVSAKTVSRAINGDRDISDETRERILRIANEMEYVPHVAGSPPRVGQDPVDRPALPAREPAAVLRTARDELRVRHRDGRCLRGLLLHPLHRGAAPPASCGVSAGLHRRRPHPHAGRASRTGVWTRCASSTTRSP